MLKSLMLSLTLGSLSLTTFAQSELDPGAVGLPQEIIVKEDAQGNREVFKVSENLNIEDEASAQLAIETFVKDQNKIDQVLALGELDRETSQEAWYYWYTNFNWNYGYNFGGFNYWYQPYFNFNWGFNNFYYYRSFWW